jgi:Leucine-rich repeat (LRR) protein
MADWKELRALHLSSTKITDKSLATLGQLPKLAVLDVSFTQITDAGLPSLAGLSSLRELDLRQTEVTSIGIAALRAKLPACTIIGAGKIWSPVDRGGADGKR